jgi:hypothetical protein
VGETVFTRSQNVEPGLKADNKARDVESFHFVSGETSGEFRGGIAAHVELIPTPVRYT